MKKLDHSCAGQKNYLHPFKINKTSQYKTGYITLFITVVETSGS